MRKLLALAFLGVAFGVGTPSAHAENTRAACPRVIDGVQFYRNATWQWQDKLGVARSRAAFRHFHSCGFAQWTGSLWRHRARHYHAMYVKRAHDWPAHRALWDCIHPHEASDWHNRDSGGNGHYGGLQMHPGWGYGTSYYASDDSPQEQEWAAERAYRASGYRHSWLQGQWGQTIGPCWQYA